MQTLLHRLNNPLSIAPLVTLRVLFGIMMTLGAVRYYNKGWIHELYVKPEFFFSYYSFEFVKPLGEIGTYLLFAIMGISALCICLGLLYRLSTTIFFLSFSYIELMDKTNYLNHYYFVSIMALLLIFVPANRRWSLDVLLWPSIRKTQVPAWCVYIFRLQVGMVYFFAGAAKLQADWLLRAMPLAIWLPGKADLPVIGPLLKYKATAYIFAWFGALYDLTITIFLLWRHSRWLAYTTVVVFHLMTALLFPIGIFPFVMIVTATIFFSPERHEQLWLKITYYFKKNNLSEYSSQTIWKPQYGNVLAVIFAVHFIIQLFLPLRFMLYPGNHLWTEQGFRFSWRVMLIEKTGYVTFHVTDAEGRKFISYPTDHLTLLQEKMMSTQPDMILQYVHYLEKELVKQGVKEPQIIAKGLISLNGHKARPLIDPTVDLTQVDEGWGNKKWILPFEQDADERPENAEIYTSIQESP